MLLNETLFGVLKNAFLSHTPTKLVVVAPTVPLISVPFKKVTL